MTPHDLTKKKTIFLKQTSHTRLRLYMTHLSAPHLLHWLRCHITRSSFASSLLPQHRPAPSAAFLVTCQNLVSTDALEEVRPGGSDDDIVDVEEQVCNAVEVSDVEAVEPWCLMNVANRWHNTRGACLRPYRECCNRQT